MCSRFARLTTRCGFRRFGVDQRGPLGGAIFFDTPRGDFDGDLPRSRLTVNASPAAEWVERIARGRVGWVDMVLAKRVEWFATFVQMADDSP